MKTERNIILKSQEQIEIMRVAGKKLASIVSEVKCSLKSGLSTKDIDAITEKVIKDYNVIPAFKGYRGFPGCACISINEEVVHGIPGKRIVNEGDIISLDIGIIDNGFYSDTASTFGIGKISTELQNLLDVTQTSLSKGIEEAKVGNHLSDISHSIEKYVLKNNFSIVKEFVGHGIGRSLHEDPEIPNFGSPGQGPILREGMVLAIEPMVNIGTWETRIKDDGWTVVTLDGKSSAHFEHCIVINKHGPDILTN